ncbi:MAG: DUF2865 domain-containing protein [Alphaproteobacteria bacterium]|nr:DUF2865 domain-containing protein [Alphaproteobacteria bacterium]
MLRVREQFTATARPLIGRQRTLALLIVVLLAGSGFFVAALLNALYRDVPQRSPVAHAAGMLTANPDRLDGRLLSPVSERIVPKLEQASQSDVVGTASQNRLLAYMKITGTDDYPVLPSSTSSAASAAPGATYKTVFVRLCDGSYFPIGYAATPAQFAAHERECRSQCGSPARLYVYANGTETPLQMRSLAGRAYLELDTAFRFQTTYDAQCSCWSQPWTLASRQRHQQFAQLAVLKNDAMPSRTITAVDDGTSPVELRDASATAIVPSLPATRSAGEHEPQLVRESAADVPVLPARAATENEVALLGVAEERSARIAAVLERTEILAALDLPPTAMAAPRPIGSGHPLAAAGEPNIPLPFGFVSLVPAAGQFNPAKKTEFAQLAEIPGNSAQPTATDILMRNLNPHN